MNIERQARARAHRRAIMLKKFVQQLSESNQELIIYTAAGHFIGKPHENFLQKSVVKDGNKIREFLKNENEEDSSTVELQGSSAVLVLVDATLISGDVRQKLHTVMIFLDEIVAFTGGNVSRN
jgi:hypothetical protein